MATRDVQLPEHFTPTHPTGGLPGFPAIDVFAPGGSFVLAPEPGRIVWPHLIPWDGLARVGGWTCYFQGESGDTYFLTHFGKLRGRGKYRSRDVIGTVAHVPHGWWHPHIHEGKHEGRYKPPHT